MAKRILDEATKRKLSGLLPFSPDSFVVWTPDEFFAFPVNLQPKFNIRPFDKVTCAFIKADIQAMKFEVETARKAIKYAVTGWRDFIDLGTQLEIDYSEMAFEVFPEPLIWRIYKKANELTYGLSPEEKEAFESQQALELVPLSKAAENADSTQA